MASPPDHYATLGVADSAPHATIRAAYRRIIREVHPDVAGPDPRAVARSLAVNSAWSVLKDPLARASYDRQCAARAAPRVPPLVARPSWGSSAVHPVTIAHLRETAARESAYSEVGRRQREAFSAASRRLGIAILLLGMVVLAVLAVR